MSKLLPKVRTALQRLLSVLDMIAVRVCSATRTTSSLYYVFRDSFSREQQAALAGRLIYARSNTGTEAGTFLLRRNIHRLEKGLLMRPRRVPFGLDYIADTVSAYERALVSRGDSKELAWARDVLGEYMRATPFHPIVEPLRRVVNASISAADANGGVDARLPKHIPYTRSSDDAPLISYEQFLRLARFRRSVRWYLPRAVPRDLIRNAIDIASFSPTACNRQPYEFRVLDEPCLVEKVLELPMGTSGFSHQVPAAVVVVGRLRNFFSERDRHLIYIDASLAIMSFVYALEVQGLSSCCINWPDIEVREKKMSAFLGLEPDERPIMLLTLGFPDPDGLVASSAKKSAGALCRFNFEKT